MNIIQRINLFNLWCRFALAQARKFGGKLCKVKFDQPLYAKAIKIVASADKSDPISNIFVRLGGFHLLMSFLGSIGYIICGSGFEEAMELICAKNSVTHIINGHACERAIRCHFLIHIVLSKLLFDIAEVSQDLKQKIASFLDNFDLKDVDVTSAETLMDEIQNLFETLSERSKTSELWLQYWKQLSLVKLFIRAERMGDFELHLYCIKCMLPYFHAAGHLHYAKYAQYYIQVISLFCLINERIIITKSCDFRMCYI